MSRNEASEAMPRPHVADARHPPAITALGRPGSRSNRAKTLPSRSTIAAVTICVFARRAESVSAAAFASPKLMVAVLLMPATSVMVPRSRTRLARSSEMSATSRTIDAKVSAAAAASTPIAVSLRDSDRLSRRALTPDIAFTGSPAPARDAPGRIRGQDCRPERRHPRAIRSERRARSRRTPAPF